MEKFNKYIKYACYLNICIFLIIKFLIKNIELVDVISYSVTITTVISIIYATFLWKYNPLEKYPRLNNKYKGIINTEKYGNKNIEVEIKHNLIYTYLKLKSKESVSKSKSFNIFKEGEDWILIYSYMNEPKILEREHSDIHYGTCVLDITNKNKIYGKYYTDRKTVGEIELE